MESETNGIALETRLEKLASPTLPAAPPRPQSSEPQVREALQARLLEIVHKPLTPRSLLELEQTARLTRELLTLGKDPRAIRKQSVYQGIQGVGYSSNSMDDYEDSNESNVANLENLNGLVSPGYELVPMGTAKSPKTENFGASILREMLAMKGAANQHTPSPTEIISAIALAREKGLTYVAAKLEAQLLGEDESKEKKTP